jgi:hypothetical protein
MQKFLREDEIPNTPVRIEELAKRASFQGFLNCGLKMVRWRK